MKPLIQSEPLDTIPAPSSGASRWRAWGIVAMLFIFMMINFADKVVIGLAAAPIMRDLGITATQFGLVSSAFFLLFVISAMIIGFVGNKVQTRWLLLAMVLIWSLAQAPMIGTVGFAVLLAGRSLLGFAEGPAVPIAQHAAHKWFDNRERNLVTGIIQSGATVGVVVASPILAWIITRFGWHAAFATVCAVGFLWAGVWLLVGREGPSDARSVGGRDTSAAINLLEGKRLPYRRILTTGTWIACVVGVFTVQWTLGVMTTWLPTYLGRLGYSPTEVGLLNTLPWILMGALFIAQSLISRRLADHGTSSRVHRGLLSAAILAVSGIAMILFPIVRLQGVQLALITVAFSFCMIMAVIGPAAIAEITPTQQRSGALGVFLGLGSIGSAASPAITGMLLDASAAPLAGFHATFLITAVVTIASAVAAALLIRPERDAHKLVSAQSRETR